MHNISPVIAEWDFKRLFGDPRDEAKFKLTPKGGSLHRDQRVNVQVGVGVGCFPPSARCGDKIAKAEGVFLYVQ